jgi:hypothetical protein
MADFIEVLQLVPGLHPNDACVPLITGKEVVITLKVSEECGCIPNTIVLEAGVYP